jgi:hypothetical protein
MWSCAGVRKLSECMHIGKSKLATRQKQQQTGKSKQARDQISKKQKKKPNIEQSIHNFPITLVYIQKILYKIE